MTTPETQNSVEPSTGERRSMRRDKLIGAICFGVAAGMVGAAYAAVPFYNWFCRTTGFNGTTQVATSRPAHAIDQMITVRFDSNVGGGLPWRFMPEKTAIKVHIGEVVTVHYHVVNESARETVGQAAYNVSPLTAGSYFQKINCFCFTEQRMAPGEKREMTVVFYVDPKIVSDVDLNTLDTITLSYTFYPVHDAAPRPVAATEPATRPGRSVN